MAAETWTLKLYKSNHFQGDGKLFESLYLPTESTAGAITISFTVKPFDLFSEGDVTCFPRSSYALYRDNMMEYYAKGYNYAVVSLAYSSASTKSFYFFVTASSLASPAGVSLHLVPDHLQNNAAYLLNSSTEFRRGGRIFRRHKDRFGSIVSIGGNKTALIYNKYHNREDKTYPLRQLSSTALKYTFQGNAGHWYLIYRASNDITSEYSAQNAVNCFLTSDYAYEIQKSWSGDIVELGSTYAGTYRWLINGGESPFSVTDNDGNNVTNGDGHYIIISQTVVTNEYQVVLSSSTAIALYDQDGNYLSHVSAGGSLSVYKVTVDYAQYVRQVTDISSGLDTMNPLDYVGGTILYSSVGTYSGTTTMKTISNVDRTDSRLLKIIELPAPPESLTYDVTGVHSDHFSPDYSERMLVYENPNEDFSGCQIGGNISMPKSFTTLTSNIDYGIPFLGNSTTIVDPKCYNSQFHLFKLSYDSYSFTIPFEDYELYTTCAITFIPSSDISSTFLFKAEFTGGSDFMPENDYPYLCISTRSNEMPLYSSAYLNYMRTGYNYDQKKLVESQVANWTGFGISALASVASIIAAAGTGGALAPLAVTSVLGTAGSLTNTLIADSQSRSSLEENLTKLKAQATNVSAANDISILRATNGDWPYWIEYGLDAEDHHELEWYFHRYGYAVNDIVDGTIDFHTRIYFDYIQGEIVPNDPTSLYGGAAALSAIVDAFSNGLTIVHDVEGTEGEDVFQYENWEVAIIDLV